MFDVELYKRFPIDYRDKVIRGIFDVRLMMKELDASGETTPLYSAEILEKAYLEYFRLLKNREILNTELIIFEGEDIFDYDYWENKDVDILDYRLVDFIITKFDTVMNSQLLSWEMMVNMYAFEICKLSVHGNVIIIDLVYEFEHGLDRWVENKHEKLSG